MMIEVEWLELEDRRKEVWNVHEDIWVASDISEGACVKEVATARMKENVLEEVIKYWLRR
jgi:hypothetical protein